MADTIGLGGYPDDGQRVFGNRLEGVFSDLADGTTSGAHGFGRTPDAFDSWLDCIVAEHGYSVGDRVPLSESNAGAGSTVTVSFDDTDTYIAATDGNLTIVSRDSTPVHAALTKASWNLVVVPYITRII